ncbi:hypothetical protein ABIF20_004808 [Bradyrhizobium japonicum]
MAIAPRAKVRALSGATRHASFAPLVPCEFSDHPFCHKLARSPLPRSQDQRAPARADRRRPDGRRLFHLARDGAAEPGAGRGLVAHSGAQAALSAKSRRVALSRHPRHLCRAFPCSSGQAAIRGADGTRGLPCGGGDALRRTFPHARQLGVHPRRLSRLRGAGGRERRRSDTSCRRDHRLLSDRAGARRRGPDLRPAAARRCRDLVRTARGRLVSARSGNRHGGLCCSRPGRDLQPRAGAMGDVVGSKRRGWRPHGVHRQAEAAGDRRLRRGAVRLSRRALPCRKAASATPSRFSPPPSP